MKLKIYLFLLLFQVATYQKTNAQEKINLGKFQSAINHSIKTAYQACVLITPYDTLSKQATNLAFSGVVVSAEGHILTAAHAISPRQTYKVRFPKGNEVIAVGLGRIAAKMDSSNYDLAMMKILHPGNWTFVSMAAGTSGKGGEACVGISYPGSFQNDQPHIRLGRLTDTDFKDGYVESTCKMEPGDSGGPLFNLRGELIGIHSFIKVGEERNFEVPIDLFRKYWSALLLPISYKTIPKEDDLIVKSSPDFNFSVPPIQTVLSVKPVLEKNVVTMESSLAGKQIDILGTLLLYTKNKVSHTLIISKSSMVGDNVFITANAKKIKGRIITRDFSNDLVLILPEAHLDGGFIIDSQSEKAEFSFDDLGKLLINCLPDGKKYISVVSSRNIQIPRATGYFGANARFIDQKIIITDIVKGSAAENVLKLNDQITRINGIQISKPREYGEQVSKYLSGDSITVELNRDGKAMILPMTITEYNGYTHMATRFAGGRSYRHDGFSKVFTHDGAIQAGWCGSAVSDVKGHLLGINIARISRTATVAVPLSIIAGFLSRSFPLDI